MISLEECESWESCHKPQRHPKMKWIIKKYPPPIDLIKIILSSSSPVSRIRLLSTCKYLTNFLKSYKPDFEDFECLRLKSTYLTHIVTDIPFQSRVNSRITFGNYRNSSFFRFLPISYLPDNYFRFTLPTGSLNKYSIYYCDKEIIMKPDLVVDSEKSWNRPEILNHIHPSPIHCASVTGPIIPDNKTIYTLIVCTGPLCF